MSELEKMAARYLAATLLGDKTGSMFTVRWDRFRRVRTSMGSLKRLLGEKGVRLRVLRTPCGALIYAYRPDQLQRDLAGSVARGILDEFGYGADKLGCLQRRLLASGGGFPHEIGLFLGYPARDVAAFIRYGGAGCALSGPWKVYHDVERAKCLFCAYRQCRERMLIFLERGMTLQEILRAA